MVLGQAFCAAWQVPSSSPAPRASAATSPPPSPTTAPVSSRTSAPQSRTSPRGTIPAGAEHREAHMVVASSVDQVLEHAVDAGVAPGIVALAADDHGVIYEGAFGKREV